MKERPILFSAPMVRAILAGTKTQTRRVVNGQEQWPTNTHHITFLSTRGTALAVDSNRTTWRPEIRCPYGQPGDRLRVKEAAWMWCERRPNGTTKTGRQKWLYVPMRAAGIWYAADHRTKPNISVVSPDTGNEWGWRLKIGRFLPSWASRITLEVTGVRVERLLDITNDGIKAEGLDDDPRIVSGEIEGSMLTPFGRRVAFEDLWKSINGPGSWEANPWVWVVEFRRL